MASSSAFSPQTGPCSGCHRLVGLAARVTRGDVPLKSAVSAASAVAVSVVLSVALVGSSPPVLKAAVFSPEAWLLGAYGMDHPGTFTGDYSDERGGYPVWSTPSGGLAVILCYDLDFTDTARRTALAGAALAAVPSNDPVPSLADTHYTHLVFRAIENRVSLVK